MVIFLVKSANQAVHRQYIWLTADLDFPETWLLSLQVSFDNTLLENNTKMMTACGHTSFYKAATNMALLMNLKIIIDIF